MATLLERRQSNHCRLGYLLVVEGINLAFTNIPDIVGTSYLGDGREIIGGLVLPSSIKLGINEREGLLKEYSTSFLLTETRDNALANLFRGVFSDATAYRLGERVTPADDPLGTSLNLHDGGTVNPRGKHIGTEYIDSSGNRRSWYIHPTGGATPFDYPVLAGESDAPLPIVEVTDEARIWSGRQVALHELVYDEDDGDWGTWADQYAACSLIWRGTLQGRGRIVNTMQWELKCDGPASMLRRLLNRSRPVESLPVLANISTTAAQRGIAIVPFERKISDPDSSINNGAFEASVFDDANDITATSRLGFITELDELLSDVADGTNKNYDGNDSGDGQDFASASGGGNSLTVDALGRLGISYHSSNSQNEGGCAICMHQTYWALLGYDPPTQTALEFSSPYYMQFIPYAGGGGAGGQSILFDWEAERFDGDASATPLDFSGYWIGIIKTYNSADNNEPDNNGIHVNFEPLFSGGVVEIKPEARQDISFGYDPVYMESQMAFPPGGTYGYPENRPSINGNTVNSMGWMVLEGKLARGVNQFAEVEFEDFVQIARCCWYSSGDGKVGEDSEGRATVHIEHLEDPRAFGLPHEKIESPWLSGGSTSVRATPMAVWAYRYYSDTNTHPDKAWKVLTRILLSSGTSGAWGTTTGVPPDYPSNGDNQPAGLTDVEFGPAGDTEIADLGLGIEGAAVDMESFRQLHRTTLEVEDDPLGLVKLASIGPMQSEDLIGSLLQGRGWSMGYIRRPGYVQPKFSGVDLYSQFSPEDLPTVSGELLHITVSDLAGDPDSPASWIPRVEQTWRSPIDMFEVSTRSMLRERGYAYQADIAAADKGAHRRDGKAELAIRDMGLSNLDLFDQNGPDAPWNWRDGFRSRWQKTVANFMAQPNRTVVLRVTAPKGQWLYPGQVFLLTNPAINSLDGQSIGVEKAQCVVITNENHLNGSHTVLAMMVGADLTGGFGRVWAGSAWCTSYTALGGGVYRLSCSTDWLDAGHGSSDVSSFDEPSWSSIGGTAYVRVHQSRDGRTWDSGDQVTATVDSVTTGPPSVTISSLSGTLLRDTYKIVTLAPYDDQDASSWVRELVMFHTDGIGSTHTSGVDGSKLA